MPTDYRALGQAFGRARANEEGPNWGRALQGLANMAKTGVDSANSIIETLYRQDSQQLSAYASTLYSGTSGGEGEATEGFVSAAYRQNENLPDQMHDSLMAAFDENINFEVLKAGNPNISDASINRWLETEGAQMRSRFDVTANRLQTEAMTDKVVAREDARQKLVLTQADTWEEAERQISEGYESSGVGKFDGGSLSLSNEEHKAALVAQFGIDRGRKYIEETSRSSDMTFDEMTDEVMKEYDRIIADAGIASPEAQLLASENREALKESIRSYSEQVAGSLTQEADAKKTRFENRFLEMQSAGYEMDDATVQKLLNNGFDMGNIYDRAAANDVLISQFGYSKDLTGKYAASNAVMSSPDLLSDLSEYAGSEVQRTTVTLSDGSTMDIRTRYGDYIQSKVTELGLSKDEAEYLSRSINQYAHTASQWSSDQWKKHITALMVDPSVTEAEYQEAVQNYKNAGLIDSTTFDEYYSKKSGPYNAFIEDEMSYLQSEFENSSLYKDYDGKAAWATLEHLGTLREEVTRIVTRGKNAGKSDAEIRKDVENLITNTKAILTQDEQTDVLYKSTMKVIEGYTDYDPNYGFSVEGQTIAEINQAYIRGDYAGVFIESAVGSALEYLQGSSATRGDDGFWDAVTESIYGDASTFDTLSPTKQEIVKANGSVALAQWANYQEASNVFQSGSMKFRSVNVDGYGMAAMGEDGIIYMPLGNDEYQLAYIKDESARKRLLNPNNDNAVVSIDNPDTVSAAFYRRGVNKESPDNIQDYWRDPETGEDRWSMVSTPQAQRATADAIAKSGRYLLPKDDPIFVGIKNALINGGTYNAKL